MTQIKRDRKRKLREFTNDDRGLAETIVAVTIGVVGSTTAAAPVVIAVSDSTNKNVQFTAALLAAIVSFGIILGFFARMSYKVIAKIDALDTKIDSKTKDLEIDVAKLDAKATRIGRRQVTLERYDNDRAMDKALASKIFGIAELNRQTAEDAGIEGLHPLPFDE
jgi:hypothetical protein